MGGASPNSSARRSEQGSSTDGIPDSEVLHVHTSPARRYSESPRVIKDSINFLSLTQLRGVSADPRRAIGLIPTPTEYRTVAPPKPQHRYGSSKSSSRPNIRTAFVPRSPDAIPPKKRASRSLDEPGGTEKRQKSPMISPLVGGVFSSPSKTPEINHMDKYFCAPLEWIESSNDKIYGPLKLAVPKTNLNRNHWAILDDSDEVITKFCGQNLRKAACSNDRKAVILEYLNGKGKSTCLHLQLSSSSEDDMDDICSRFEELDLFNDKFGVIHLNSDEFSLFLEQHGFLSRMPKTKSSSTRIPKLPNHLVISHDDDSHPISYAFKPSSNSVAPETDETSEFGFRSCPSPTETSKLQTGSERKPVTIPSPEVSSNNRSQSVDLTSTSDKNAEVSPSSKRTLRDRRIKPNTFFQDAMAFGDGSFRYVFSDKKSTDISSSDFKRLDDGEFLNDTLINFFLKMMVERWAPKDVAAKTYIFNTFFYEKLMQKGENGKSGYDNVKKWTSKVNLFEMENVIIPIHSKMHWYVAVIYNLPLLLKTKPKEKDELSDLVRSTKEEVIDNEPNKEVRVLRHGVVERNSFSLVRQTRSRGPIDVEEEPLIMIFDSLRSAGYASVYKALRDYITAEAMDKVGVKVDRDTLRAKLAATPQQNNYCDCGVYLVHFMERFLDDPKECITTLSATSTERNEEAVKTMWQLDHLSDKREHLRKSLIMIKDSLSILAPLDSSPPTSQSTSNTASRVGSEEPGGHMEDVQDDDEDIVFLNENRRTSTKK